MVVINVRFGKSAALICKMDVSCITTQQIVSQPVDVHSSVSKSGIQSLSRLRFLAYAVRWHNWALGRGVCIYPYPGGTHSILEVWTSSLSPGGTCGIPRGGRAGSGGGAAVPWRLKGVGGCIAAPLWQGRQLSIWYSQTIAGSLFIAAFTSLCAGHSTPHFWFLRLWHEVPWWGITFCPLRRMKTLVQPFWPYSRPAACRTVLVVPDLIALP